MLHDTQIRIWTRLLTTCHGLAHRLEQVRDDGLGGEGGYTTETIVVTALLVTLALTAVGVIAAAVISKAHNIPLG